MQESNAVISLDSLPLPPSAPKVRITAGLGTVNQKTWVLRRPATLIGTGRQSQIVLPNPEISRAHCLLVNTGRAVMLKDLHSQGGTLCGENRVDMAILSDGDVLHLGESVLQVAIAAVELDPEASLDGDTYQDPLLLPEPVELRAADGRSWTLTSAVSVIGRSPNSAVHLDQPEVSLAHAAIFCVGSQICILDLDSRNGLSINGEPRQFALLQSGDRLRVGPCELSASIGAPVQHVGPALERSLRPESSDDLARRAAELDGEAERLSREREALETTRANLERERAALQRQAAALRESEAALELRRRSLEQRERTLRETLLIQAQGALSPSPFLAATDSMSDSRRILVAPN